MSKRRFIGPAPMIVEGAFSSIYPLNFGLVIFEDVVNQSDGATTPDDFLP